VKIAVPEHVADKTVEDGNTECFVQRNGFFFSKNNSPVVGYRIRADLIIFVIPTEKSIDGNQKLQKREKRKFESAVGKKIRNGQEVVETLFIFVENGGKKIQAESGYLNGGKKPNQNNRVSLYNHPFSLNRLFGYFQKFYFED